MVTFVGLDAYRQAGGIVTTDLFSQHDEGVIEDMALIHQLAVDKLRAVAADIAGAEGWSWFDIAETVDPRLHAAFDQAVPEPRPATAEEQERLEQLAMQQAALQSKYEDLCASLDELDGDDARSDEDGEEGDVAPESSADLLQRQTDEVEEQIARVTADDKAVRAAMVTFAEDVRAAGGIIVALDGRGGIEVVRGLIARRRTEVDGAEPQAGGNPASSASPLSGVAAAAASQGHFGMQPPKKEHADISERLAYQLSAHRTAIMQAAMIERPEVAMVATVHRLLEAVTGRRRYADADALKIGGHSSFASVHDKAPDLKGMRASDEMKARINVWRSRIPSDAAEEFAWLLALDGAELHELFALCVALSLDATTGSSAKPYGGELACALRINVADYWSATGDSYLGAVSKDTIIAAVEEACGRGTGMPIVKMKKAEAVIYAQQKLAGTRWLPAMLRQPANPDVAADAPLEVSPLVDASGDTVVDGERNDAEAVAVGAGAGTESGVIRCTQEVETEGA